MGTCDYGFCHWLPKSKQDHDAIWVVVDRLTTTHFIPISISYTVDKLSRPYLQQIVKLHGVLMSIVSDRDARFTSNFWNSF
jgi:hypothetical protein